MIGEGNFVLTQSEGEFAGKPTVYHDLFRIENGQIAEHWDVMQEIPAEMPHGNGMLEPVIALPDGKRPGYQNSMGASSTDGAP